MGRKRKKRRYTTTKSDYVPETPQQMRDKLPEKLVESFFEFVKSGYNEEKHEEYIKEAVKYKGEKYMSDPISSGKLTVELTRATLDLREEQNED